MKNLTDACYELLGIPPAEQPANHYRLLGLSPFESNRQVIQNAADRMMAFVRQLASGPYSKLSQELLNLLAEARICLLNHVRREQYDENLIRQSSLPLNEVQADEAQKGDAREALEISSKQSRDDTMRAGFFERRMSQPSLPVSTTDTALDFTEPVDCTPSFASDETRQTVTDVTECHKQQSPTPQHWVIGADPDCDIVVSNSYVSRRHCQLTRLADGFLLQDLGSRNGTFVNGQRLTRSATVTLGDHISLGKNARMPWPKLAKKDESPQVLRIGRDSKNDVVLQDATVSQHHAELRFSGEHVTLTDLGSLNGTYLDGSRQRIGNAVISGDGVIRFGRFRVPMALLLAN